MGRNRRKNRLAGAAACDLMRGSVWAVGYVIETAGKPALAKVVRDWLALQLALVPLVPSSSSSRTGLVIERWRILNNAGQLAL